MDISKKVIEHRRWLHKNPELAFEEFKTAEYIRKQLDDLGIPYKKVGTGTIADLNVGSDQTIALRADIDALPIKEINDKPYKSQIEGKMHACGHDAHTAMLLTAAEYMVKEKKPSKNVRFIFQPAEEGGCGACEMVKSGAVDGVDMVFGIHVSGNTFNVVPTEAKILGTIRTFSDVTRNEVISNVESMKSLAHSLGGNADLDLKRIAPPVINSTEGFNEAMKVIKRLGFEFEEAIPTMGSEDFAYYLQKVKGAFFFLGIHSESKHVVAPHHSPYFDVDEEALQLGVKFFLGLTGSI